MSPAKDNQEVTPLFSVQGAQQVPPLSGSRATADDRAFSLSLRHAALIVANILLLMDVRAQQRDPQTTSIHPMDWLGT